MRNAGRKVVILNDVNSDIIEQAILILKSSASDEESKILQEAEKVVEKYMDKKREKEKKRKKLPITVMVSAGAILFSICILVVTFFN